MPTDLHPLDVKTVLGTMEETEARKILISCIGPGGRCACGEPAVIRYVGSWSPQSNDRTLNGSTSTYTNNQPWNFCWPRCAFCPGTVQHGYPGRRAPIRAMPMEDHHRNLLKLLGDEDAFVAAVRLGYRPPVYGSDHSTVAPGLGVDINLSLWETVPYASKTDPA